MSNSFIAASQKLQHIFHISAFSAAFPLLLSLRIGSFVEEPSESSLLPCKYERQRPTPINTSALSKRKKPWIIQLQSDNRGNYFTRSSNPVTTYYNTHVRPRSNYRCTPKTNSVTRKKQNVKNKFISNRILKGFQNPRNAMIHFLQMIYFL